MVERIDWSRKDLAQNPDLKLRDEVFNSISNSAKRMGFIKEWEKLDPQHILIPTIKIDRPSEFETKTILEKIGWGDDGFSIIFIGKKASEVRYNEILAMTSVKLVDSLGSLEEYYLHLFVNNLDTGACHNFPFSVELKCKTPNSFEPKLGSISASTIYLGVNPIRGVNERKDENVLLFIGDERGLHISTLLLPEDWKNVVKDGKLTEKTEEKPRRSVFAGVTPEGAMTIGYENLAETPEFSGQLPDRIKEISEMRKEELRRIVASIIKDHLGKLGLEFDPQDISVPSVSVGSSDLPESETRTRDAWNAAELPGGFSVICVGKEKEQHVSVVGSSSAYRVGFVLGFKTGGGGISYFKYSHGRNPSIFVRGENNTEFRLGRDWSSQDEYVLLAFIKNGRREVSSLALPAGWKFVFDKDGKLIGKPAGASISSDQFPEFRDARFHEEIKKRVEREVASHRETNTTAFEAQKTVERLPQLTFAQMVEKVKSFPFYRGPAENKKGIRTASFGAKQTPVEIASEKNRIVFTFFGLNEEMVKKVCRDTESKALTVDDFKNCFTGGFESKDKLVLDVSFDGGDIALAGRIVRFDAGKNCDSQSPFCYDFNFKPSGLEWMINNKGLILPKFFSQLKSDLGEGMSVRKAIREMERQRLETMGRERYWGLSGRYTTYEDQFRKSLGVSARSTSSQVELDESSQTIHVTGFKDKDPEDAKIEHKAYWNKKRQKQAEFRKRQKGK